MKNLLAILLALLMLGSVTAFAEENAASGAPGSVAVGQASSGKDEFAEFDI